MFIVFADVVCLPDVFTKLANKHSRNRRQDVIRPVNISLFIRKKNKAPLFTGY